MPLNIDKKPQSQVGDEHKKATNELNRGTDGVVGLEIPAGGAPEDVLNRPAKKIYKKPESESVLGEDLKKRGLEVENTPEGLRTKPKDEDANKEQFLERKVGTGGWEEALKNKPKDVRAESGIKEVADAVNDLLKEGEK